MTNKSVRTGLTIVMDFLVLIAVLGTIAIVVRFFGALGSTEVGSSYLEFASLLRIPAGFDAIKTPYGGTFDVDAAVTVALVLLVEWALSVARRRT